jgi:hypothetical protein
VTEPEVRDAAPGTAPAALGPFLYGYGTYAGWGIGSLAWSQVIAPSPLPLCITSGPK